jgi:OPT family oligopeptide transporter
MAEAAAGDETAAQEAAAAEESDRLYTPAPGEAQLTVRAVVVGCLLGGLVAAMNIYFGLKTGWSIGGSLIAAILGYAVFAVIPNSKLTRLEANIIQTSGSGAGSMTSAAGLLAAIPALGLMGRRLSYVELTLWALAVAYLGVFFAVPLRTQMVVQEKLRFPTGTATANTLMAVFSKGDEALAKAKALLYWAIGAGVFTLVAYFAPPLQMVPLDHFPGWLGGALFAGIAAYGFKLYVSPLMYGAGVLIGMRVAASLALGAVVAWALVAPAVEAAGWVEGATMSYADGARGWLLWPGVAIMVSDALTSLALSLPKIFASLQKARIKATEAVEDATPEEDQIGMVPWAIGMSLASLATVVIAQVVFDIAWWMTLVAIAVSSVLSVIATRSVGETDINPLGGMGKVTQLIFGALAPGVAQTNLMAAAITSGGANQAGDMMQDLKTGYLLGASPRKQLIAQCVGVFAGILFAVPIYLLFDAAYEIGIDEQMPAPAANSWKAMAELLAEGFDALPAHAESAILVGVLVGIAVPVVRHFAPKPFKGWVPSTLAFGIAFIVPAFYSLSMFTGAVLWALYARYRPQTAEKLGFAIASGLLAGEGLMGIVTAILTLLGIDPIWVVGGGGH